MIHPVQRHDLSQRSSRVHLGRQRVRDALQRRDGASFRVDDATDASVGSVSDEFAHVVSRVHAPGLRGRALGRADVKGSVTGGGDRGHGARGGVAK